MPRLASIAIAVQVLLMSAVGCGDNASITEDGGAAGMDGGAALDGATPDAPVVADAAPEVDAGALSGGPTLLITEVALANNAREFIEIYNPTDATVDLGEYYLCDDDEYHLLPGAFGGGPGPVLLNNNSDPAMQFDFLVKFPDGAVIAPGQVVVIALRFTDYFDALNINADYGILQAPAANAMVDPGGGNFVAIGGNLQLTNAGEMVALFRWDGVSDLVQDIDLVNVGMNSASFNRIPSKTGVSVDGPDSDSIATRYAPDRGTIGLMDGMAPLGQSHKRIAPETGAEAFDGFGNGLTGQDETSENLSLTWDLSANYTSASPGTVHPSLIPAGLRSSSPANP